MKRLYWLASLCFFMLGSAHISLAADGEYVITLKDNAFTPAELVVPAGQKIKLTVKNAQPSTAEFESSDLEREKLVGANSQISVSIGPLAAGKYNYVNDFHRDSTGVIIAK